MRSKKTIAEEKPCLRSKFNVQPYLTLIREELKQVEARLLQQGEAFEEGIRGYFEYALEGKGKRIRPALCLLAGYASGGLKDEHYDLAVVVELIHLASLIHDDILDQAEVRRGLATTHAKWGVELAVLLGDCLLAHAIRVSSKLSKREVGDVLARGANEVCMGEIMQTQRTFDLKFSVGEYLKTIEMKTASLFAAPCEAGALLNDCPTAWVKGLHRYGVNLGIAYQIYDDCLDLFGMEIYEGKTLGTDLVRGKWTLPILHALGQMKDSDKEVFTNKLLGGNADHLWCVEQIVRYGGHLMALRKVKDYVEKACKSLEILPESKHRDALTGMALGLSDHIEDLKGK